MESFHKIIITIAIAILLIFLFFIAISLYRSRQGKEFPPVIANCPDYWIDESPKNNGSKCVNKQRLGNKQCSKIMNFSGPNWAGNQGLCAKSKWAKSCGLTWDGIDNNSGVCSSTFSQ